MPTVEFSSPMMTTVMSYFYSIPGSTPVADIQAETQGSRVAIFPYNGSNRSICYIGIYGGTRPTTRAPSITTHSANLLAAFSSSSNFSATVGPVTASMSGTTHNLQIITNFAAASATGTASWFAINQYRQTDNVMTHFITGSVGTVGSGADLIISDTNIVSGQLYKIANLQLSISSVFNY